MDMTNATYDALTDYLEGLSDEDLVGVVSELNSYNDSLGTDEWMEMDSFDDVCCGMSPTQVAMRIYYGDFNPNNKYFRFDGYANFESTDYPDYDTDDIIEAIDNIPYQYLPSEIQSVMDNVEEEEEVDKETEAKRILEESLNQKDCFDDFCGKCGDYCNECPLNKYGKTVDDCMKAYEEMLKARESKA